MYNERNGMKMTPNASYKELIAPYISNSKEFIVCDVKGELAKNVKHDSTVDVARKKNQEYDALGELALI